VHPILSLAFGFKVMARARSSIGVERAHVEQAPYAVRFTGLDNLAGKLNMSRLETAAIITPFIQDPDQVDHGVRSRQVPAEYLGRIGITLEELEGRYNEQMLVPLPLPCQYPNPVILLGEPVYQVAAYKARATHNSQDFELHTLKLISRNQGASP
jgi:hypothetical protein